MENSEVYALFWDHIEELRSTFIRVFFIVAIGVLVSFCFYERTISWLTHPLRQTHEVFLEEHLVQVRITNTSVTPQTYILSPEVQLPSILPSGIEQIDDQTYRIPSGLSLIYLKPQPSKHELTILGPLDGMFAALKASLWMGIVFASPFWMLMLMRFIAPALRNKEKRLIWPFLFTSFGCMTAGCAFALTVTIPLANSYLVAFNEGIGSNMWSINNYLDYTLLLLLANAIGFELGAIGIFAVRLRLVTVQGLVAKRRHAAVVAFVIGALLTPPDVITQAMVAMPLIVLYEGLILYARLQETWLHNIKVD